MTGQGLRVEWDVAALHLSLWREVRQSGGRWRGQAEILALEPSSVRHSLGLARAVAEEQAIMLDWASDSGADRRDPVPPLTAECLTQPA